MSTSIQEILAPLDPHWDRIIRRPMSSQEVDALERQVGLRAPAPLREYLLAVGLFQDLTHWQASPIEVYESPTDFDSARRFLCEILPPNGKDLFPFGGDGAGNVYCLPTAADAPCRIHFVDHETSKISKRKDFDVWLQAVVAKVLRGIRRRVPNEYKVWAVQFTFNGTTFEQLKELLAGVAKFKEIDSDWMNPETSDAGVTSSERQVELNGVRRTIGRLECPAWKGPMIHFEMREPLAQGLEHSQIRALNTYFKQKCPGYRLVDYGPLDSREIEKAERGGRS